MGKLIPITKTRLNYIKAIPKADVSPEKRLKFYLPHLESADEVVSDDAYLRICQLPLESDHKDFR